MIQKQVLAAQCNRGRTNIMKKSVDYKNSNYRLYLQTYWHLQNCCYLPSSAGKSYHGTTFTAKSVSPENK